MRRFTAVVGVIMLVLLISCTPQEPYIIGFAGSLSGHNADMGTAGRNGVLFAVEEINSKGGIDGRLVEVILKDHQMNPDLLPDLVRDLSETGAELIIGPYTSVMTKAILPEAASRNMTVISPTASSKIFLGIDDQLIRMNSTTSEKAKQYSEFLVENEEIMSCAILYDSQNEAFTKSWLNDFTEQYEGQGGIIRAVYDFNSSKDTDFSVQLEQVVASEAEVLLVIANSIDSATLIQQLRHFNDSLPVMVSEWAGTRQLIELGGKAVEGVMVLQSFDPFDESGRYRDFHRRYLERFQTEPSFPTIMSYDACLVTFKALSLRSENQSIKDAILENSPYEGLQEGINLDQFGDAYRQAVYSLIRNGQFRKLE